MQDCSDTYSDTSAVKLENDVAINPFNPVELKFLCNKYVHFS